MSKTIEPEQSEKIKDEDVEGSGEDLETEEF